MKFYFDITGAFIMATVMMVAVGGSLAVMGNAVGGEVIVGTFIISYIIGGIRWEKK